MLDGGWGRMTCVSPNGLKRVEWRRGGLDAHVRVGVRGKTDTHAHVRALDFGAALSP